MRCLLSLLLIAKAARVPNTTLPVSSSHLFFFCLSMLEKLNGLFSKVGHFAHGAMLFAARGF